MTIMYCPRDQRDVETVQGYDTLILILLLIFTAIIGGIIYYILTAKPKCPFCGSRDLMAPAAGGTVSTATGAMAMMPGQPMVMIAQPQVPATPSQTCPSCGRPLAWYPQQNRWFCPSENKWL